MNEVIATTYFAVMVRRGGEPFKYLKMNNEFIDKIESAAKFYHINDAKQFYNRLKPFCSSKNRKIVKAVSTIDIRDV